jgi:hypothetical protein
MEAAILPRDAMPNHPNHTQWCPLSQNHSMLSEWSATRRLNGHWDAAAKNILRAPGARASLPVPANVALWLCALRDRRSDVLAESSFGQNIGQATRLGDFR